MDKNNNIPNSFDLPEGYFNKSKAGILNKIEWMQEHEAFPVLSNLNKETGFIVPLDYFNSNATKLELLDAPVLSQITKQNAFNVPENYFSNSSINIISAIEGENELNAYPVLSKIEKNNPFITKDNYFETSKQTILKTQTNNKGAKIISLNRKPLWFAAAAVLTIVFSLWIYNSFIKEPVNSDDCNTMACLEKRELDKFKLDNFDTEELIDASIDLKKLEKNLKGEEQTESVITNDSIDETLLDYMD